VRAIEKWNRSEKYKKIGDFRDLNATWCRIPFWKKRTTKEKINFNQKVMPKEGPWPDKTG
jgi:hypothetical protein